MINVPGLLTWEFSAFISTNAKENEPVENIFTQKAQRVQLQYEEQDFN